MKKILIGLVLVSLICFVIGCGGNVAQVSGRYAPTPTPTGMVLVPATGEGGFQIGQVDVLDAEPVHTVNLSAFYI